MREIKFRGKRVDDGEWVYGDYYDESHLHSETVIIIIPKDKTLGHKVDPSTVGQYTGLKDKNGKEIYDGDVMKECDFLYLVEWRNITIWLKPLDKWSVEHEARPIAMNMGSGILREVIGNKWDNPELLKE